MNTSRFEEFEIGPIRPPSEGGSHSLLLRFTRNCSWNHCTFCYGFQYDRAKFQLRSLVEIKSDIDKAKEMSDLLQETSKKIGFGGRVHQNVVDEIFRKYPQARFSAGFVNVLNWLYFGGKTVFLQDADTLIMRTSDLVEAIAYLKKTFPAIERITSYARSKTAFRKSFEELDSLKKAGLSRLHIGLESGDDEVLKKTKKGVTAEQHIKAGKKVRQAGIELSAYVMPGLGGKEMSFQHAENTAKVLNEIDPDYIRSRPFFPIPGTPIAGECQRGEKTLLSPHELLEELASLVKRLRVHSKFCFDHAMNPSTRLGFGFRPLFDQDHEGYQLPHEKEAILEIIEKGLQVDEEQFPTHEEIARFAH